MEKSSNVPVIRMVNCVPFLHEEYLIYFSTKARGIADGLMYLHNQDVVHSDLKSVTYSLRHSGSSTKITNTSNRTTS